MEARRVPGASTVRSAIVGILRQSEGNYENQRSSTSLSERPGGNAPHRWRSLGPPRLSSGFLGGLQDEDQASRQEVGSKEPPDQQLVGYLFDCLDLLAEHHVETAVVFPPLVNRKRETSFSSDPAAPPYLDVADRLAARAIPMIALDLGGLRARDEFVNPGHLNDRGAQRFSRILAQRLRQTWSRTLIGASR